MQHDRQTGTARCPLNTLAGTTTCTKVIADKTKPSDVLARRQLGATHPLNKTWQATIYGSSCKQKLTLTS